MGITRIAGTLTINFGSVNILMGLFKKTDNTQKNKEGSLVK